VKQAAKTGLILLAGAVAVMASQEEVRAYASDCLCGLLNCLFGF
jgi:hypothetical protein